MQSVTTSFNTNDIVVCLTADELVEMTTIILDRFIAGNGISETLWRKIRDSQ